MNKKAIIFDLDNTIYPVASIGDRLFAELFQMIADAGVSTDVLPEIKHAIMRRPFQLVAASYQFSVSLTIQALELLENLQYDGPIEPFADFTIAQQLPQTKFLVTTGFEKLQQSKIAGMGIAADFKEIYIVDPTRSGQTKQEVFTAIIDKYKYQVEEVLVVGDDLLSEISAADRLGINAVLYDALQLHPQHTAHPRITHYQELEKILMSSNC